MTQEAPGPRPDRTVQIENEKVLVVMWRFPPGACLDWHRHEYDYVVVPLTSGNLTVSNSAGRAEAKLIATALCPLCRRGASGREPGGA